MLMTTLIWILAILAVGQGIAALADGWRNARYAADYASPPVPAGRVLVCCPVRGEDPELADTVRSLLDQGHPDYRVLFLVADPADPATAVLRAIPGAEIVFTGASSDRGQKVHSLCHGITEFGSEADVFAFADADARFPPDWLEQLVAPLGQDGVGATTGYRWYVPAPGNWPSWIRSAWNGAVAGVLRPGGNNFAWGGSMAIRREIFESAGILGLWRHAVSDDYALTRGVRRAGLGVRYVPTCLVAAYGACSWRELIEFTTRQIRITRVYAPAVWRIGAAGYTLFNLAFLSATVGIGAGEAAWVPAWLLIYGLSVGRAWVRWRGVSGAVRGCVGAGPRIFYLVSPPLIALLWEVNFVLSLSRRIVWKGVAYTMVSPEETRVRFPGGSSAGQN